MIRNIKNPRQLFPLHSTGNLQGFAAMVGWNCCQVFCSPSPIFSCFTSSTHSTHKEKKIVLLPAYYQTAETLMQHSTRRSRGTFKGYKGHERVSALVKQGNLKYISCCFLPTYRRKALTGIEVVCFAIWKLMNIKVKMTPKEQTQLQTNPKFTSSSWLTTAQKRCQLLFNSHQNVLLCDLA